MKRRVTPIQARARVRAGANGEDSSAGSRVAVPFQWRGLVSLRARGGRPTPSTAARRRCRALPWRNHLSVEAAPVERRRSDGSRAARDAFSRSDRTRYGKIPQSHFPRALHPGPAGTNSPRCDSPRRRGTTQQRRTNMQTKTKYASHSNERLCNSARARARGGTACVAPIGAEQPPATARQRAPAPSHPQSVAVISCAPATLLDC